MFQSSVTLFLCVSLSLALSSTAVGQTYDKLLDFTDNIRVGGDEYDLIAAHCFEGDTAYFIVRGIEDVITPGYESQITKVENINGTPVTTLLVSNAQWKMFTGLGQWDTIYAPNRMAILGDYLQFLDWNTDAIYRVHKITGALSVFVSKAAVAAVTGNANVRLLEEVDFSPCGDMVFYEQTTARIMTVDINGNLSTLLDDAALTAFYGYRPINHVAGGMAYDRAGNLYWTLSQSGTMGPAGGSIYKRQASDGSLSLVIPETVIKTVTNSGSNVAFNDIYVAPDGNVYFYDRAGDVDSILYFDPGQPVTTNSLMTFLTEAEVKAGPAGPAEVNISALNTFAGKLTWHHIDRWYDLYAKPLAGPVLSPADFDGDGDVDLTDYAHLAGCIVGPNQPPASSGCCSADLDQDRDVDLADFAAFQAGFAQ